MQDVIRLPGGALVRGDGSVLFRQEAEWFEARAHDLGRGHVEITAKKPSYYVEGLESDLTRDQARLLAKIRTEGPVEVTEEELERRRLLNVKIAANRAKTNVRKHCKAMGCDTMLTLTTREAVTDEADFKVLVREMVRRIRRVCPTFCGVSITEPQKRGAWHAHIAVPRHALEVAGLKHAKVKSYDIIRAVWRSVTKEKGGNIDVSRRKAWAGRSAAKIAAYLAKYLAKAFEMGEAYSNRWTRYGGKALPPSIELGRFTDPTAMLVGLYGLLDADHSVVSGTWSHFGDWFYLAAEKGG